MYSDTVNLIYGVNFLSIQNNIDVKCWSFFEVSVKLLERNFFSVYGSCPFQAGLTK